MEINFFAQKEICVRVCQENREGFVSCSLAHFQKYRYIMKTEEEQEDKGC